MNNSRISHPSGFELAIIGMSGRFPGAKDIEEFWRNLQNGVESISFFSDEELLAAGAAPEALRNPDYVRARGILQDIEQFDAAFFGYSPREAEVIDPQHRLFLECAWEALEDAGYDAEAYKGRIGVYAGANMNTYLLNNLHSNRNLMEETVGGLQTKIGSDKDFLTTRVSYKLNLTGPSVAVQTACSTSLVAVHLACQGLLSGECDIALAGGVSIGVPQKVGYFYQRGGIVSPDGHCRAFDAQAAGTVGGNGLGVVVLKRLADALADGDGIRAVILGSAINNDGGLKAGYTAPSVEGQAEVIVMAQAMAGVAPETIGYIEAHGAGTQLGDPIEVAALRQAFGGSATKPGFCAIGSVKTNIGHLDAAAGVVGLIKTVLALERKQLPPSLHFERPNPQIDFADSPFYVNTVLREWTTDGTPRRAGVSSFGMGGTNAHVVLEEAPLAEGGRPEERPYELVVLSAKTASALETMTDRLVEHFKSRPELNFSLAAFTLQVGRQGFEHRRSVVCRDLEDAVAALETRDAKRVLTAFQEPTDRPIAFLFPGQGTQYVNMGRELYQTFPQFRREVDRCCELLLPHLGLDLREVIYPDEDRTAAAEGQLNQTRLAQPALFVIEYALAQLWLSWGVQPEALLGHSLGEYVAATVAGVWTLDDALGLAAARGRLMQQTPEGAMLAAALPEAGVRPLLGDSLSLAAVNEARQCVVSGPLKAVEGLEAELKARGVGCRRLKTVHAFHSALMESVVEPLSRLVSRIPLRPPRIPVISNLTGTRLTAEQAQDPGYWGKHLRQPVRFADGVGELLKASNRLLVEVGPGRTLTALVARRLDKGTEQRIVSSLGQAKDGEETAELLRSLGQAWVSGIRVDWSSVHVQARRQRLPLPTYPFERQRYWVDPQRDSEVGKTSQAPLGKKPDIADWFYIPSWKRTVPSVRIEPEKTSGRRGESLISPSRWLAFIDACGLGEQLVRRLLAMGQDVVTVAAGERFAQSGERGYTLNPQTREDYDALIQSLDRQGQLPDRIVHLWTATPEAETASENQSFEQLQALGFYSLLYLAQGLGKRPRLDSVQLTVVSNQMQEATGEEPLRPEKATLLGPCKVIPQEYPNISCRSIDIVIPRSASRFDGRLIDQLLAELTTENIEPIIAYRGNHRLAQTFEPVRLKPCVNETPRLREGGVYLITGGLGGVGLVLAEHLAKTVRAKLILTGRSTFPSRDEWERRLNAHEANDNVSQKIRKVQALEELGAEALIFSADVANLQQMQEVIAQARARFGQIHGVIHAAGLPDGAMIQRRTREMTENILAPKVKGTLVLDRLLKDAQLDFFLLCSSLASIHGPVGQVGYCAANAFLDAFAYHKAREGAFAVSVNWDTWQEVGMAVEAAKQLAASLETPQKGGKEKEERKEGKATRSESPLLHPLFDHCIVEGDQEIYVSYLSASKHWVLNEHRIKGKAILPGTAYLEIARAALEFGRKVMQNAECRMQNEKKQGVGSRESENSELHAALETIEMRDVYLLSPLAVEENEEKEVRVILAKQGEGFEFVIVSRSGSEEREHARGKIGYTEAEPPEKHEIKAIEEKCNEQELIMTEEAPQSRTKWVESGPRWNNLRRLKFGSNEGAAILELPEAFAADMKFYQLHPALLDAAASFLLRKVRIEGAYLPFSYKRLKIKGPLPRKIFSYARCIENDRLRQETLTFDITLMDDQGIERVEIEGYTLRKVDIDKLSAKQGQSEEAPYTTMGLQKELLKEGIFPSEGVDVFSRILRGAPPQIVVSTQDLAARLERSKNLLEKVEETRLTPSGPPSQGVRLSRQTYSRPELKTAYVPPRDETEQTIADIWGELLGVKQVGVHDNFFELGGHSLLATQVVSRLRNAFQVELPLGGLFEEATVADLARRVDTVRWATQHPQASGPMLGEREEIEL